MCAGSNSVSRTVLFSAVAAAAGLVAHDERGAQLRLQVESVRLRRMMFDFNAHPSRGRHAQLSVEPLRRALEEGMSPPQPSEEEVEEEPQPEVQQSKMYGFVDHFGTSFPSLEGRLEKGSSTQIFAKLDDAFVDYARSWHDLYARANKKNAQFLYMKYVDDRSVNGSIAKLSFEPTVAKAVAVRIEEDTTILWKGAKVWVMERDFTFYDVTVARAGCVRCRNGQAVYQRGGRTEDIGSKGVALPFRQDTMPVTLSNSTDDLKYLELSADTVFGRGTWTARVTHIDGKDLMSQWMDDVRSLLTGPKTQLSPDAPSGTDDPVVGALPTLQATFDNKIEEELKKLAKDLKEHVRNPWKSMSGAWFGAFVGVVATALISALASLIWLCVQHKHMGNIEHDLNLLFDDV